MTWTFLDAPQDGAVFLVYIPQSPNPQVAHTFSTDGYVWADGERMFTQEYKGFVRCMHVCTGRMKAYADTARRDVGTQDWFRPAA
jgi:hypothetical protein